MQPSGVSRGTRHSLELGNEGRGVKMSYPVLVYRPSRTSAQVCELSVQ